MIDIMEGDCRETLKTLPENSIHCCVTSPPYFGLRDYKCPSQIGLEATPEQFVAEMVSAFREVRRVLRPDGTLWLNLGDSYAGSWGAQSRPNGNDLKSNLQGGSPLSARQITSAPKGTHTGSLKNTPGCKAKDLIGIPWMVAFALRADGWYLRQEVIWHKPNPMPESVRDRCTKAHEQIFLFSKFPRYYFDSAAIQEPAVRGTAGSEFHTGKTAEHQQNRASSKLRTSGNKSHKYVSEYELSGSEEHRTKAGLLKVSDRPWGTRNKRTVWTVPTKGYKGAHFATYPPDLIKPCILAGCPKGGTVLDPFAGTGTTGQVADAHGRNAVLCELNADYIGLIRERCGLDFEGAELL